MNINNVKVGQRVFVKSGCYTPKSFLLNGEQVCHYRGEVVEVLPPNIIAVKFYDYEPTVDMLARELVAAF